MTHLCVPIFVTSLDQAKRDIARGAEAGADVVELRIDQFTDPVQVRALVSDSILPCILTCRATREGGQCESPDADRLALLDETGSTGSVRYIDTELDALRHTGSQPTVRFIASSHDFSGRPERLYNLVAELNASPSDVNKIVWTPRSIRDNLEAFEILKTRQKPTIALCMGEAGLISRILAKKFGAFLTFASLDPASATAPGQVSIADMKNLYRWDAIQSDTKIYGVVAQPVMHSMSPAIHNAAFSATNHNGLYLPFLVEGSYESFKAFMETFLNFDGLDLSGLSVTLPHKENALRYLQEKNATIEPLAERIGAVNTIIIRRAGLAPPYTLEGRNTDYAAILDSITDKLNITRDDLANYRIAVLGAGGTGRTAVAALAHYGATVVVYNRTKERADALAKEFNGKSGQVVSARIEKLCDSCCHIFLNTTSVGMYPNVGQSPLGDTPPAFTPQTLVFDTIYNPLKTKLLEQAESAGAMTIGGIEMFVRQAAAQFEAWTGNKAPAAIMRQVIERRLAR
jgi:3-dehydroquinate dehydratase/shikimate dehydrogenase